MISRPALAGRLILCKSVKLVMRLSKYLWLTARNIKFGGNHVTLSTSHREYRPPLRVWQEKATLIWSSIQNAVEIPVWWNTKWDDPVRRCDRIRESSLC